MIPHNHRKSASRFCVRRRRHFLHNFIASLILFLTHTTEQRFDITLYGLLSFTTATPRWNTLWLLWFPFRIHHSREIAIIQSRTQLTHCAAVFLLPHGISFSVWNLASLVLLSKLSLQLIVPFLAFQFPSQRSTYKYKRGTVLAYFRNIRKVCFCRKLEQIQNSSFHIIKSQKAKLRSIAWSLGV